MSAIILLVVCLLAGLIAARVANPPTSLPSSLNWWVMNIALPALILQLVPHMALASDLWFLPAAMWIVFLGASGFFLAVGRVLQWSRRRIGALTLVGGLGNTSFVGFALIEVLRGQEGLKLALVTDQMGSFTALVIGGSIVTSAYSGAEVSATSLLKKIILFPPFVCIAISLIVARLGGWPATAEIVFTRLGDTLVPIALFSVGLQLRFRVARDQISAIGVCLLWKLALAPILVYAVGAAAKIHGPIMDIGVLEAAMAPMVTATILADQNDLEPELANIVLGLGIVLSFATVPIANALL